MLRRAITCLLGLVFLVLGGNTAFAQDNSLVHNDLVLPEMVVTGTRFPTEIERVYLSSAS
mgnify:FL=1